MVSIYRWAVCTSPFPHVGAERNGKSYTDWIPAPFNSRQGPDSQRSLISLQLGAVSVKEVVEWL
jgi:hypothetical protein